MRYLNKSEFNELLLANALMPYMENTPDKDAEGLLWSIYGHPPTNELIVALSTSAEWIIAAVPSPVLYPAMADRVFGIDRDDMQAAEYLSHVVFQKYQTRVKPQ